MSGDQDQTFLGVPAILVSPAIREVIDMARRVARSSVAVLITGQTGSGKEIVARAIHHYSLLCSKPWVDINCGALPDQLMESELFGHEKGAFSGADAARAGLFELAHGGSLFLDEVGELDARMQVKLLRVLDGVPYYRLGGQKKVAVDVRIIAATN
jgi:transcriptional regulator with GAF, ATPase, and Fis domain